VSTSCCELDVDLALVLVNECLHALGVRGAVKSLSPEQLARALRVERDLAQALNGKWDAEAQGLVVQTAQLPVTQGVMDHEAILQDLHSRLGSKAESLATVLEPLIQRKMKLGYMLGKEAAPGRWDALRGVADRFDLVDSGAVSWLKRDAMYWVGQQHNRLIGSTVADTVREAVVEAGASRRVAAKLLQERVSPMVTGKRSRAYWNVVAGAAVTRSRAFGSVNALLEAGATTYTIVNPLDEVTSKICRHLAGKTFQTEWAHRTQQQLMAATTPEQAKVVAPWMREAEIVGRRRSSCRTSGRRRSRRLRRLRRRRHPRPRRRQLRRSRSRSRSRSPQPHRPCCPSPQRSQRGKARSASTTGDASGCPRTS